MSLRKFKIGTLGKKRKNVKNFRLVSVFFQCFCGMFLKLRTRRTCYHQLLKLEDYFLLFFLFLNWLFKKNVPWKLESTLQDSNERYSQLFARILFVKLFLSFRFSYIYTNTRKIVQFFFPSGKINKTKQSVTNDVKYTSIINYT